MGNIANKCKTKTSCVRRLRMLCDRLAWRETPRKIYMVGLSNAGKTSILYQYKFNEATTTVPTIGFNVESFSYKTISFTAWDFSGREQLRPLWRYYFDDTAAVIFVVDSASTVLMQEAAEVLHGLLKVHELKDVPFLVYVNKQDIPTCMSVDEVAEALQLNNIISHDVQVQGCCAQTGDGLYEGLDWLCKSIR
ncbi:arf/Sar family, other [Saprolegnia diclina VS20]|uniref:Arf/Sar family, other n=1 Tax=Saprolegnia diclina (strain VS20) TaxID=1156394 RepID=T0RDB6_SAPDV|nr:arf/Sar family, other [Saprolegnia diclina VS20]EQC27567.1 arf/Sar family, other [Saprolegnia diclina VS20]|eukprot:XP_008618987.1 arf/Sar family, other [Saprolegnia diclina VS20]